MNKNRKAPLKTAKMHSKSGLSNHPQRYQSEEINELREKCKQDGDFSKVTDNQLIDLQKNVTAYARSLISQEKYANAKAYQELSGLIAEEAQLRIDNPSLRVKTYVKPTMPKNVEQKLEKFNQETEDKVSTLKIRHEKVLQSFENLWDTQIKERYLQESNHLRNVKKELVQAQKSGDSEAIEDLTEEISYLEEKEQDENMKQYEKDHNVAHKQLVEKQEKEIARFYQERRKLRNTLLPRRELVPAQKERDLRVAVSKLTNKTLLTGIKKPKIIAPELEKNKKQQKTSTSTSTCNSAHLQSPKPSKSPSKNSKPEIGVQCDPVPESEFDDDEIFFDDAENEGVLNEDEINIEEEEEEEEVENTGTLKTCCTSKRLVDEKQNEEEASSSNDERRSALKTCCKSNNLVLGADAEAKENEKSDASNEEQQQEEETEDESESYSEEKEKVSAPTSNDKNKALYLYQMEAAPSLDDEEIRVIASSAIDEIISNIISEFAVRDSILNDSTAGIMSECLRTCIERK